MPSTNPLAFTPVSEIPAVVRQCREGFLSGLTRPLERRKELMRAVLRMVDENEEELCRAVHDDLRKHPHEAKLTELSLVRVEGYQLLDNLDAYAAPETASAEGLLRFEDCTVRRDPLGVILIVCPWNYPLQLTLVPLLGALAAGNTVVLKPSEISPATAAVLQELLPKYVPSEVLGVVNGGVAETTRLLEERFDHILYTGNSRVGSVVMAAAAKHLTPVTLELGGKSPVIVDGTCTKKIQTVAKRIMWGKVLNAGQTCVAPDYVLVHSSIKDLFVDALKTARQELLGDSPLERDDYACIVNAAHYKRVHGLMNGGTMLFGGEHDDAKRLIAPAVFDNVPLDHPLMTDEIFGPLLPLIPFNEPKEAIAFVCSREKPLALYIFSDNDAFISSVLDSTSSGGVCVNDVIMHVAMPHIPFGGVGQSGMGAYHGKYSFELFSHRKSVMRRTLGLEFANEVRYPPYTPKKLELFRKFFEPTAERSPFRRHLWNTFSPLSFLCSFAADAISKHPK